MPTRPAKKRSKRSRAADKPATQRAANVKEFPDPKSKQRAAKIYRRLKRQYPDAQCALEHENAYQLLVATILSAQCTDKRVNMVTPELFRCYPDARRLAAADPTHLESLIQSTGFYRSKAKNLRAAAEKIVNDHGGQVPATMEALIQLPGVARKTANVVLGNAFDTHVGVVVDTHIGRLSRRLGLTGHTDPNKVERDLMALFPRRQWTMLAHLLIAHGRAVCTARSPDCGSCCLADLCPKVGVPDKQSGG